MAKEGIKPIIVAYLEDRAKNDELFAKAYAKENKSIDECIDFIFSEAHKMGNAVCVSDAEVFGWAVHYYDEDNIKINKTAGTRRRASAGRDNIELTDEEMYSKHKSRFFGICFGDDDILISVITSVADIYAEGEAMHHCVYTNGYYKKPDSLILSARDRITDHRIETIEVSLKSLTVIQSRGVCNENTIHHGRIIELVNNNIHLIKKAI